MNGGGERYSTPPGFTSVSPVGAHSGFGSASTSVLEYDSDYDFPPAGLWWLPRLRFCVRNILQAWRRELYIHSSYLRKS